MKSILKPEGSVVAGIATIGVVYGLYQLNVGTVAEAHATRDNHPALETSRKKAGYSSLVLVSGLSLLTKDPTIFILGCATVIAMEIAYRHGIMVDPLSGKMTRPSPEASYAPAENVVAFPMQGQTG
jgi:hypothetical protein